VNRPTKAEFVIVGSGFGGAFSAHRLARAGRDVLVIERGAWPVRDDSCWDEVRLHLEDPMYRGPTPFEVDQSGKGKVEEVWPDETVGGQSVFYGAAAYRMREEDFRGAPVPGTAERDPSTAWPIDYGGLEPYYQQAEVMQGVAGLAGEDITEPARGAPFPQDAPDLTGPSERMWKAAEAAGLHPARIPLAINFDGEHGRGQCVLCSTCDHFACKVEAKNDVSVAVLPGAMEAGTRVVANTRVVRVLSDGHRATGVEVVDQRTGDRWTVEAEHVVMAAGALGSPHLLLASGIRGEGRGNDLLGRNLIRHINCIVSGAGPRASNPDKIFHKMVAIPDFYFGGSGDTDGPPGPWGLIQEIQTPGPGVLRANAPFGLKTAAVVLSRYLVNLLCISEDQPQPSNRVSLDDSRTDELGMPRMTIHHRYAPRDIAARNALAKEARKILRKAGVIPLVTIPVVSFSHAMGTCRFGSDPDTSVLDPECRLWGWDNLYVVDGSFMPTGGSVNPSLTIGANALRVADGILRR
jgi:choline dehydrogenase-like flavoprotein